MEALDKGDSERLAALIAPECESKLENLRDRQESKEVLAMTAALFAGANITETIQRRDGRAAFVEMRLPNKRLLTVFLDKEGAEWRIVRIVDRASPSQ
jgi:hypothetical protein